MTFITDKQFAGMLGIGLTKFSTDKAKGYYDTVKRFARTEESRILWVRESVEEFIESKITTAT